MRRNTLTKVLAGMALVAGGCLLSACGSKQPAQPQQSLADQIPVEQPEPEEEISAMEAILSANDEPVPEATPSISIDDLDPNDANKAMVSST